MKKILVTGSEGYIGKVLVPQLIKKGYNITGIDSCFFVEKHLYSLLHENYQLIKKDIRDITASDLLGYDAVIHLAGINNDTKGILSEDAVYDINYKAAVHVAKRAKEAGIKRFVFASSCSVYGKSNTEKVLIETDETNPQNAYAESKLLVEKDVSAIASENFSPVFLRKATVYGPSPAMRFFLVANSLTGFAHTQNEIKILGDGKQWRSLVYINDVVECYINMLEAPQEKIHNQIFNVGNTQENYQIKMIAETVQKVYQDCQVVIANSEGATTDYRTYCVSGKKLQDTLKFSPETILLQGIKEMKVLFEKIPLTGNLFKEPTFHRTQKLQQLVLTGFLDKNLRQLTNLNPSVSSTRLDLQ